MGLFLHSLREGGPHHRVEATDDGFAILRRSGHDREAFNDLAREALAKSGYDFLALPLSDGARGYEQVVIIPIP